jgi:Tfp pilus assembly protein PilO
VGASKLKVLHIVIIFVVVYAICAGGLYFALIKPKNEELAKQAAARDERATKAARLPSVQRAAEEAERIKAETERKYARYRATKMPKNVEKMNPVDPAVYEVALWQEHARVLGPLLMDHIQRQPVRFSSQVSVPTMSVNPSELPQDIIHIPIQGITVTGTYRDILKFLRSWNNFPRVVTIDSLTMQGFSPFVTATINLTVHIFPEPIPPGKTARVIEPFGSVQGGGAGGGAPGMGEFGPGAGGGPPGTQMFGGGGATGGGAAAQ